MELGLDGARVLVTGASGVIGRAVSETFGQQGAAVAVGYHSNREGAYGTADLVERAGGKAVTVRLDLTDPDSVTQAVDQVTEAYGGVDVLINNAVAWPGFPEPGELFETAPIERMWTSLRANLYGHYLVTRAVVGGMRRQRWGRVVHVSTGLVEDGFPGSAAYLTAKAGLYGLTRSMSRELAGVGILTNQVLAGFVPGDKQVPEHILDQVRKATATGRTTEPSDVAHLIVFLSSRANTHVTGESIRVDGHFLAPLSTD